MKLFIAWHDYPKAICYYEKLYKIYPNDKEINIRLASMYKAVQDYEKSRVFFRA
ncbi:MAG: hypothetical protein KKD05_02710 [Candidatus Omnitrophica bacterium]|nr:hypothetical protein [Candidatus Omnitrophota bacterium]